MYAACSELGISLVGGHTEITYGLDRPMVIGQMLGEVEKERLVTSGGAREGDAIVLTKGIAIEGTALIAREKEQDLRKRGYAEDFITRAQAYLRQPGISVFREARRACLGFDVHAMHDPTEGGLATGLRELALASQVGLVVDEGKIEVLPECRRLCAEFGLDPLGTIASGALLLALSQEDATELVRALAAEQIPSAIIGRIVPEAEGLMMETRGHKVQLPLFPRDEIARLFAQ
jgi:hydrogenase maturation factor